jgi:hypothetical protein
MRGKTTHAANFIFFTTVTWSYYNCNILSIFNKLYNKFIEHHIYNKFPYEKRISIRKTTHINVYKKNLRKYYN